MAGKKQYSVTVPLVIAKTESGDRYLYQGAIVPGDVSSDEVKRLLEGDFIVAGDAPAEQPDGESDEPKDEEPSDRWSNEKLTDYAAEHSIDLGTASTKKELLAAIAAAGSPAQ